MEPDDIRRMRNTAETTRLCTGSSQLQLPGSPETPRHSFFLCLNSSRGAGRASPEKYEVALVVKCGHLAAVEVGVLVKEGGEHAAQTPAQPRVKVLQNKLRLVSPRNPVALSPEEGRQETLSGANG